MRYSPFSILLAAATLLGGCLTLQPPAITANSVSLGKGGRRGFFFPVPPGYQASSPEEFDALMGDLASAYTQSMLRQLKDFQQTHRASGESVIIYRQDALASGKPGTIIDFCYNVQAGGQPMDQHPSLREQRLAQEQRRLAYDISKNAKILSSEIVSIHSRKWVKISAVEYNKDGKPGSYYYTMATFGDLNESYQFSARTFMGPLSDSVNIVDYMAERMEI